MRRWPVCQKWGNKVELLLFIAQRVTAMILAPLVIIHLGLILLAVRGSLTGAEILARTQGSIGWALFYVLFVVAASVHAPIGLRNILVEWTRLSKPLINVAVLVFALLLLSVGLRAVVAVI